MIAGAGTAGLAAGMPIALSAAAPAAPKTLGRIQLPAIKASISASLSASNPPGMWIDQWTLPDQTFQWSVDSDRKQQFVATLLIVGSPGSRVLVEGPYDSVSIEIPPGNDFWGEGWNRITASGTLTLSAGSNNIVVRALNIAGVATQSHARGGALQALELIPAMNAQREQTLIAKRRADSTWLADARFGVMLQWGEWGYPKRGPKMAWPKMIDAFDVERFADAMAATGAGYVIWSATWRNYYFPAPIASIDAIIPGRTSRRDLIGEIARALRARNMRMILYYNSIGNTPEYEHFTRIKSNPELFEAEWRRTVAEVGTRYGDLLAGWFIDEGVYPRNYEAANAALKAGNPERLVTFNSWIRPRLTDFADYFAGEGFNLLQPEPIQSAWLASIDPATGKFKSGPQQGLQSHGCFLLDTQSTLTDWGIWKENSDISDPMFSPADLAKMVAIAKSHRIALSFDIMMYEDGAMSPRTLEALANIKKMFAA